MIKFSSILSIIALTSTFYSLKSQTTMTELTVGDTAPYFEGVDDQGNSVKLSDYSKKKLILYFYPKDDTPGCTAESCNLNDNYQTWLDKGYEVIGVSPDDVASHQKFKAKYQLKFTLIADTDKEILKKYQAWGEKTSFGKTTVGVLRKTYVIDEKGIITQIFGKVDTKNHTQQILKTLNGVE